MQKRSSSPVWQPPTSGPGALRRPPATGLPPGYRPGRQLPRQRPEGTRLTDLSVLGLLAAGSLAVARARSAWAAGGRDIRMRLAAAGAAGLLVAGAIAGVATMAGPSFLALGANGPGGPSTAATTQGQLQLPLLPPIPLPANLPDINLSGLVPSFVPPPPPPSPPPPPASPPPSANNPDNAPSSSTVADARLGSIPYYSSPGGAQEGTVPGSNVLGQTESFLVVDSQPGWYHVELPIKPDGSTGWIRSSDVTTRTDTYAIVVHQASFKLNLYDNGSLIHTYTVAVGAPSTPTPDGNYYVLVSQAYNGAPYAVGIFGLSVFSTVLQGWAGGGEIGIHGWQDTSILGTRASHGCVRMSGADFQELYNTVPMGTPVQIDAQ